MTTICFVHDAPLTMDTASRLVYSQGFDYKVWQRYLEVFDSVIVCTRMKQRDVPSGMGISSGDKVKFLPAKSYQGPLSLIFRLPTIYREVAKAVSQADAVVLRLPSMLGLIGYVAARRTGSEYLVELVGSAKDAYFNSGTLGRLIAPAMTAMTRHVVRRASFCIYVTESFLQKRYPTCGLSAAISDVELETSPQPASRQEPSIPLRIGSAGKVDVPYKGYGSVISVLPNLPNVEFEVAGGGDPTALLAQAESVGVQSQVKFLGMLDRDELFDWLDTLDVYLQPSLTEGLPRAVLEAMSRGLPVIATNVGGLPELLDPEFLFEPGDSEALDGKIRELLEKGNFGQIGAANHRRSQDFDSLILQDRRKKFLLSFRDHVVDHNLSDGGNL